jgi:hypothetical protein
MAENQLSNQPIDPDLQRRLKQLRSVPARDPEVVARNEALFVVQVDELLREKGFSPAHSATARKSGIITYIQQLKEKWKMATPMVRMAMTLTAVFVTLFVFLFGGAGMTAYANQNALPGDTLYGIKTGFEQTRLTLARDAADKARLNLAFAERRLDEIARLIEGGRYADISLAVQEYEQYVQSAITALETVAAGDPSSLPELAALVADSLKRYAATLAGMTASLPDNARSELERAIRVSTSAGMRDEIEFTGTVERITTESWTIAGRTLVVTSATEIKGLIIVGDRVKVHAYRDTAGNWILREVEKARSSDDGRDDRSSDDRSDNNSTGEIEFTGIVEQITDSVWVVSGRTLIVTPASEIEGRIRIGDWVEVEAWRDRNGNLILIEIERENSDIMNDNDRYDDDRDDRYDDNDNDRYDDDDDDE